MLRSSSQKLLIVPKSRLKSKGNGAFSDLSPTLWNSLSLTIRSSPTSSFKSSHTFFLRLSLNTSLFCFCCLVMFCITFCLNAFVSWYFWLGRCYRNKLDLDQTQSIQSLGTVLCTEWNLFFVLLNLLEMLFGLHCDFLQSWLLRINCTHKGVHMCKAYCTVMPVCNINNRRAWFP